MGDSIGCAYIPYKFVKGSLKMSISGGAKVKNTNNTAIAERMTTDDFSERKHTLFCLKSRVSYKYEAAAETKKIAMFSQSGDLEIAPL